MATKESRRTVGALSRELMLKDTDPTHSPLEQTRKQLENYQSDIEKCIADGKKNMHRIFYVVVLTKKEKLMKNVLRNYFFSRISCPTPNYDQVVYKFTTSDEKFELLWVIPDKKTSKYFIDYKDDVDSSQFELLSYVLKFADGSLFKLAKNLNNEKDLTPELKDK